MTIGVNVKKIPAYLFCQHSGSVSVSGDVLKITTVVFGEGSVCESIGNSAFSNCSSLTSIEIPDGVTSIGKMAFSNCSSLTGVYITDIEAWYNISFGDSYANPLCYAKNLYLNNELVTELEIPNTVTEIKDYAFYGCESITSITILDSVTSIGKDAFIYCANLTSVTIGDSVTSIGNFAFSNCDSLTSIEIPDSVTSIGDYAFYFCRGLTSVVIGDSVTSIGESAFNYCSKLTSVYYKGTVEDWKNIQIDYNNNKLTSAERYYYSETTPSESGNYWHYDENGEIVVW